ncbi:MAG: CopG family transcriptional regulator [Deltaproteobacteria bacterium]|nr:CopG family transcriptional regulator [Deltaproteobacteria bacterium]
MKRKNIHLTDKQVEQLEKMAKETGLKVAEIIRRALDDYLKKNKS